MAQGGGAGRAEQNRKEAECDSALARVLQGDVQCHATWGVWRSTAWSEWSAKGQRSLAPPQAQVSCPGKAPDWSQEAQIKCQLCLWRSE